MNPIDFHNFIAPAAATFFDEKYNSKEAQAQILAIGLQESQFKYRRQLIGGHKRWWESLKGPAVSYFQFERIGIRGVLEHHSTEHLADYVLKMFDYPSNVGTIHRALVHNDLLAAVFARLALYRYPAPLPVRGEFSTGWIQYLDVWRPGKPHPERWEENFNRAWKIVDG